MPTMLLFKRYVKAFLLRNRDRRVIKNSTEADLLWENRMRYF